MRRVNQNPYARVGVIRFARIEALEADPLVAEAPLPPPPGAGQVVVRMRAAGLNFADLLSAAERYQDSPALPYVPGLEGAGEVVATGEGTGFRAGERVAVAAQGTLAEMATFPASALTPLPDGIGWEAAAGLQIAYGTSHLALVHRAALQPGDRFDARLGDLLQLEGHIRHASV